MVFLNVGTYTVRPMDDMGNPKPCLFETDLFGIPSATSNWEGSVFIGLVRPFIRKRIFTTALAI